MWKAIAAILVAEFYMISPAWAVEWRFATEQLAPFTYEEDGKSVGPMADIIAAVCSELHRDCRQMVLPWRRALQGAESGEFQGIYMCGDTPERRAKFFVQVPLLIGTLSFVVPAESSWTFANAESVKGQEITVYGPSTTSAIGEDLIKQAGSGLIIVDVSNEDVVKKLAAGHSQVGLVNKDVALDLMRKNNISNLKFVGDALLMQYSIGLSRESLSDADARAFADALDQMKASGRVEKIIRSYGLRPAD